MSSTTAGSSTKSSSNPPVSSNSDNSSTTTSGKSSNAMALYFIPPVINNFMQWGETVMILIFISSLFLAILLLYVYVNIDQYRTRISVISNAALFGQDPQAMFQYFIQNAQAESIATAVNNIKSTTQDINTTTYRLDDKTAILQQRVANDVPASNAGSTNLGISIQTGLSQISDMISKLGGAFVLNNYMNKGAVQTTRPPK
jgi:hypothetical protein